MERYHADVIIVGSGLAALVAADQLGDDKNVIIITKSAWQSSNSFLAQGGIAATYSDEDDWRSHLEDALRAGHDHNDEHATECLVKGSRKTIQGLIDRGMVFDLDVAGEVRLAREGGHRRHRILHAGGDATGKALALHVKGYLEGRVTIHENTQAMDLLVENGHCSGLWARNENSEPVLYQAHQTIVATGGIGHVYEPSSNHPNVTGDGLAMAYRAGASLADMEFVQFHPTLLVKNNQSFGLVSEAVRGEGAVLINQDGERMMKGVHPQEDLAPRDIVARTLFEAKTSGRAEALFLDITKVSDFEVRFPTITRLCLQANVDLAEGRVPVSPGAHFSMGGIVTDLYGRTNITGLYACGEAACTGVHGANRIASHSLLEAITFAVNMAEQILADQKPLFKTDLPEPVLTNKQLILPEREVLQQIMFQHVGIIRNDASLRNALNWLQEQTDGNEALTHLYLSKREMETLNMLTVSQLIATSALERMESRGGHYRTDCPNEEAAWYKKRIIRERVRVEQF
ncbi:L-aspartate oxidase [Scopulibacillus darangshiensis]|uniref:L-aspartate oxidase n=1 Tax=Scopulibacillus darangshiensis TaxID=442528 RepID=A0A4R2NDG8_9BACL|nr:L-aspartate oxidase [Scopulibacillus darangshiensis]TCP19124.1 L-aspartate oxidase [Scopulibacillus darangshiensis]